MGYARRRVQPRPLLSTKNIQYRGVEIDKESETIVRYEKRLIRGRRGGGRERRVFEAFGRREKAGAERDPPPLMGGSALQLRCRSGWCRGGIYASRVLECWDGTLGACLKSNAAHTHVSPSHSARSVTVGLPINYRK